MRALALGVSSLALIVAGAAPAAAQRGNGLLFRASLDRTTTAEVAGGAAEPNFRSNVAIVPDGRIGGAAEWADDGYVAWSAPGNIRAARGTLSFFWRPRTPVGEAPFNIFRVAFADHSSWDMAFLRIDWNGHGFDAFVTDANLSRERVSWRMPDLPAPTSWHHIAFAWDEAVGVRLFVDGKEVARVDAKADLDSGLDQFGLAGRVLSPHQVQSRYNFMRGSDVDELRVYDRMLGAPAVAALAAGQEPAVSGGVTADRMERWRHRYGWDTTTPPVLSDPVTRIRKVEFADAKDLKQEMWKGVDGIPETTWPGVYNRSRLPGRDDYFELPDWNVYVEGGRRYDLTVPAGERFNQIELRGAAYGTLTRDANGRRETLARRPKGVVRSITRTAPLTGGTLHFTNVMQEQPIQELWAYDITAGAVPAGTFQLDYTVRADAAPTLAALAPLNAFIAGRYPPEERATVLALPTSGVKAAVGAGAAGGSARAERARGLDPIVHILIPASFGDAAPDQPVARAWDYGWQNLHDGLDGIAIELPALKVTPGNGGLVPLNIKVKDPIWPGRDMIDVSLSVRPDEKRTLWLDLRDRILSNDSLYLTIASAAADFDAQSLDGARIRLVFKPRAEALREHVADRLNQVKDNWGFLVEEHTASQRLSLYRRLFGDITDLLRVDPDNQLARTYWADIDYRPENMPAVTLQTPPAGVPLWAFRQLEDLKYVRRFVDWWIDERQVPYGDFGGGISDDVDLTQQWPGVALMGVKPDKIAASLRALDDAVYRNGMIVNGLGHVTTDELHAYEEGLNVNAERLYLNWGEPVALERLMDNTRGLTRVITRNPAGHLHFASSWYGGRKIYTDMPWAWQKPYAFSVLHGPTLLGIYNGNPVARGLVTGLADGLLAHEKTVDGRRRYPNEINWFTDAERAGDGGGASVPLQTMWAAWHFTGEDKYLRPLEARVAAAGPGALAEIDDNVFDLLPQGKDWRASLAGKAGADPFALYARWAATGDLSALETLHADAIVDKASHEYLYTRGHWWSDRVEQPSEILQRERLGAIALRRGQHWPANAVSWRFDDQDAAERVAILVEHATPTRFRVVAVNTGSVVEAAEMGTWNVDAGRWRVSVGSSPDGGRSVTHATSREVALERSAGTRVSFAPGTTTVIEAEMIAPGTPVAERADLGIGRDDVKLAGRRVTLTVHSLGARATGGGEARLVTRDGAVLARVPLPPLDAPSDLRPRTARVALSLPRGVDPATVAAAVALPGDAMETTLRNNRVPLVP